MNEIEVKDIKVESKENKYAISFENAKEYHSGKFRILAKNVIGTDEFQWNINVESKNIKLLIKILLKILLSFLNLKPKIEYEKF